MAGKEENSAERSYGAIARIDWLCDVLTDARLQIPTVAVFAADLIKRTNSQTGEAYPSISRIAGEYGLTRQALSRGVGRLIESGKLESEARAGRTTVYRIVLPATGKFQVSAATEQLQVQDLPEIAQLQRCNRTVAPPETEQLHDPLSEPGTLQGSDNDKDAEQHPLAEATGAFEMAGDRQGEYEWFWNLYPAHSHVKVNEVERMLSSLAEKGITREQIEPGLQRFRNYANTVGSRMLPLKFLTEHHWRDAWQVFDRKKNPCSKKIEKTITANADGHVADVVASFRSKLNDIKVHITGLTERKTALLRLQRDIDEAEDRHIWGGPEGAPPKPETARKLAYCEQCFDAWYNETSTQCSSGASLRSLWDEVDDELENRR